MSKGLKKVWSVFTTLIVVAVLVLALLLAGVRLFGLQVFAVLSGSMEPAYHTGSLIYVKKVDPFELKEGDVITFMLSEDTIATHRIAGVVPDEDDPSVIRFRTKGDANDSEDGGLVHYKNVLGTPVFTIPYLGYVAEYIQHPPGLYVTIAVGAFLILLMFMPELISVLKDDENEKPPKGKKPRREKRRTGEKMSAASEEAGEIRPEWPDRPVRKESGAEEPERERRAGERPAVEEPVTYEPERERPVRERPGRERSSGRPRGSHEAGGSHEPGRDGRQSGHRQGGAHAVKGRHEK